MPVFYALVDAVPGQEEKVGDALRASGHLSGVAACKERSHDFLVRFEAGAFDRVDDVLQTYVRTIPGVQGVEIVTDWDGYGDAVQEARAKMP